MASLIKPTARVYLNGHHVPGVRSADVRLAVGEVQQATLVLFCDEIKIDDDGRIYIKISDED